MSAQSLEFSTALSILYAVQVSKYTTGMLE